ncbi:MAG TPA: hypothetical protein VN541_11240 [Tepidisphaeraceae bacterium]|nr:hypothetical protein [Tepidisphaeraceae bacterium]
MGLFAKSSPAVVMEPVMPSKAAATPPPRDHAGPVEELVPAPVAGPQAMASQNAERQAYLQ